MQMKRWMWLVGAPTLLASCALDSTDPKTGETGKIAQPLDLTAATRLTIEGILDYGTVVFAQNPTTLLEAGDFHAYEFAGKAGGVVTITMTSTGNTSCGALDTFLSLFGPEDEETGARGTSIAENDDAFLSANCFLDSQIRSFRLPVDGEYLVVATSFLQEGGGHYRLVVNCNNGVCKDPEFPTFATTRINQTDIDRNVFTPTELFDIGDFLFESVFRVEDGMGNALIGAPAGNNARPNFREFPNNVHFAAFGAPEAQSCVTCHNGLGLDDGAGDNNHNIFQIGDGVNRASGVPRNPPAVIGNGYRQQIGIEMTRDLQAQLAAAKAQAASTRVAVTRALASKNVSFGSIVANVDGTVNFTGLQGIDTDLIVKPFGWKGREATLRRFVEGGFRVHFGLQTSPSIANHCRTPNVNTFGTGANCLDADGDGVQNEVNEGQLTAEAIYMGLREVPVRVPAISAAAQQRAVDGEALFNSAGVGCNSCHRAAFNLADPVHAEPPDTTGGAAFKFDLRADGLEPRATTNANGSMTVVLWSDFKRHDMGAALADVKNFNQIAANQFITPPLWGVADSAPYLHDGRALTLDDAIRLHGGEATTARNAYVALSGDNQKKIQEFLLTLGRAEDIGRDKVDLGGFDFAQFNAFIDFNIPRGTLVSHGGYVVIGRAATRTQFQAFYNRTLDANTVYINAAATGQSFPNINGNERYALFDDQGVLVEGPTIPEPTGGLRTLSRLNCSRVAGATASWTNVASSISAATPGFGLLNSGAGRVCISEIADVGGGNPANFEFIELFVE
jgi:mono/diheme cytochrome c family protein